MCGILGQVSPERPVDRSSFEAMLDTLRSRGPDGWGCRFLSEDRIALGHRRLSIIDLSEAAAQPMPNEDETIWLVFNGEIYNFRDLRKTLESLGHRFRSRTDSEVIVHGYEEWGDECVHRLRGIFAFGLWDGFRRRLLLARDHLGVKPLYYWKNGTGIVFASQPRAILQHPDFRKHLDERALRAYLAYRYVPREMAIFQGMAKLPAAHRLILEGGQVRTDCYWQPRYRPVVKDLEDATRLVEESIEEAVRLQMVSDVPIGVFLSGGIDSSTILAIVSAACDGPVPSFTIGFDVAESDERSYARVAAKAFGADPAERVMTIDDAVDMIPAFIDLYDEPFYDHSGMPTFMVSDLAREHRIKVVISGDGGDELFAGYRWYDDFTRKENRSWIARAMRTAGVDRSGRLLESYFDVIGYMDGRMQGAILRGGPNRFDHLEVFREYFHADVPLVTAARLFDLHTFLVDDILTKVDRASMACGVEVRVPLLDRVLVEAAFSIDSELVYGSGKRKSLMKRAVSKWVPAEILTARKKGFSIPLRTWMDRGLFDVASRLVSAGILVSRGVFDATGIRNLLERRDPSLTWLVLVAELWARRWLEGEDLRRLDWSRAREAGRGTTDPRS